MQPQFGACLPEDPPQLRRGWCRLFWTAENTLMFTLAVVVRNVREEQLGGRADRT
ncbi:MAG: hypothetical protein ACYCSX_06035 [Acidimicrobiales bacterium]